MPNMNKVILCGHATRDPELRYTPQGLAVTTVGMAVNDRRKGNDDQWIEDTVFVDVAVFGKSAEYICDQVHKGTAVLVDGKLKLEQWESKKDGSKQSKLKVIADRIDSLAPREPRQDREIPAEDQQRLANAPTDCPF